MQRWVPAASACAWFLSSCVLLPTDSARADIAVESSAISSASAISSDYLRGIDALDSGRLSEAVAALERVVAAEPDFSGARMDLARAQFASGNYARADSEFRYLLAQSPPARARAVIQRYLDAIPGRGLLANSRWSGAVQFGAGYDSNANGSTNDPTFLGFTLNPRNVEISSPFGELALSGGQSMSLAPSVALVNALQITHRSNTEASFVDQSTASLSSTVLWSRGEYRFNAGADAYWSWLDSDGNDRGFNLNAGVSRSFGQYDTALSFRAGEVSYQDGTLDILDVNRFLMGLAVTRSDLLGFPVKAGVALLGGKDDPKESGSPYGNDRYGARVFGTWQLRPDSGVYAELSHMSTDYDGSFFGSSRRDHQLALAVSFERQDFPAPGWSIAPRLRYLNNDSSISLYGYDRLEAMVFLRRSFHRSPAVTAQTRLASVPMAQAASDVGRTSPRRTAPAEESVASSDPTPPSLDKPERRIEVVSPLGMRLDITEPNVPGEPRVTTAIAVPRTGGGSFTASTTENRETLQFSAGGSLLQFDQSWIDAGEASSATYLAGNAAPVDFGSNGATGIRWGRWSASDASVRTPGGSESLDLRRSSLHWIAGPLFETSPTIPISGSSNFVLAGGTSPTDDMGNVGTLAAGVFTADFTHQQVRTQLSLDVNGYNWFATGSGSLDRSSANFSGTFGTVLVDGRVAGSGEFSGFLSAGPLTWDQINGVGLSYRLSSPSAPSLGTVSGVAAFLPGGVYPLAPPPVQRDLAYAAGQIGITDIVGATATNTRDQMLTDAGGNLRRFSAAVPGSMNGVLSRGMAQITDTGFDTSTGIRWGRWTGGAIDLTVGSKSPVASDFTNKSLHWILGNEFASPPVLPQTGTASYTLVGNTNPTDTFGRVGTLGTASLNANFTTRIVSSEMTLNIGGMQWYASGEGTWSIGDNSITGSYDDVRIQNVVRGRGSMYGFFTAPRALDGTTPGVGLSFSLADNVGQLGVVSGALAFAESSQSAVVTPPPTQERDIAYASPDFAANETFVQRQTAAEYSIDRNFNLTSFAGQASATPTEAARYTIGSSALAESGVAPATLLRWGRWAGGEIDVMNLSTNTAYTIDAQNRSLHWIESADSAAPPTMPMFGTVSYTLAGGTSPTDRAGHSGILNQANLTADFTNQLVSASLNLSINNANVVASGNGNIGAAAGLSAHQFTGAITGGTVSTTSSTPQGTFSGFFTAPNPASGVPAGAGITYSINVDNGALIVDGAAALRP